MKTSHQNQALPKAQHSTAEGGSMHVQRCCLWLKLQPSFSWIENSCSQGPLRKEEGKEGRGGCVCSLESASTPASTCLYPWTCQMCQTGCPGDQCLWLGHWVPLLAPRGSWGEGGVGCWRGDVKHGIGDEGSLNTNKQGWTQQWDVHGILLHAMHSTLNLLSSNN